MSDLDVALAAELAALERQARRRRLRRLEGAPGPRIRIDGREVLNFGSNNYLGLTEHPEVRAAAVAAAREWGTGSTGSRLLSGNLTLHEALEEELAAFLGTEAAILFSSGYLAAVGTIPALVRGGDLILSDALNHASLIDGCRLSRAEVRIYRHRDADHAAELLADRHRFRRCLVVTDGVFSMDGTIAPARELAALAERHDAWLMVDDAHGIGVLGPRGGGVLEYLQVAERVPVRMGTLSKALAAEGGFVAGSWTLVETLRNRARGAVFSTAPAPPSVAAARTALRIAQAEPHRRTRLRRRSAWLRATLQGMGLDVPDGTTPIVPLFVGENAAAVMLAERLETLGVWAPAVRPPSVPEGTARLRICLMASHTAEDLRRALGGFQQALEAIREAPGLLHYRTDTGVGKTVVTAALAAALRVRGVDVGVMKPVETGVTAGPGAAGVCDAEVLARAAGLEDELELVGPVRLREPLAPLVAARLEGREVRLEAILTAYDTLLKRHHFLLVEGAGGLAVPVAPGLLMSDLAREMNLPLLVVARPSLGTINHTVLTVAFAKAAGLAVAGIVINGMPAERGLAEATSPAVIEELTGARVLAILARDPAVDPAAGALGELPAAVSASALMDEVQGASSG